MGDHRAWSPELNGVAMDEKLSSSSSSSSPPPLFLLNHAQIGAACWGRAEEAAQGIIYQIQPTLFSEQRRKAVIDYVQRLLKNCVGCEVFPFGSVPLKTYLPDGDIDLTAFGGINAEEALVNNVVSVLESEDQNGAAEFVVKDVQLIRAEVKLVKCLVQNIVVDISFNQLGGLCTLCFLEQVDRFIGRDHLFKRSIILIKAWCYYESRILGAHHGLISTYALETLVLFIFHLFHSTLNDPLEVLFKFLDYFSKFDWDNFGISLHGPVRMSLLPEIVVETPDNGGEDLLLSNDFLTNCIEMFSVPAKGHEPNTKTFSQKYLNIVDPLKENNNLGRSVSKGNFYRIRSAFTYGARKLGRVLSQSKENIENEVRKFFANTLDRHGNGQRPDVQDFDSSSRYSGLVSAPLFSGIGFQEDRTINGSEFAYSGGPMKGTGNENYLGVVAPSKRFSEVNGLISHYRLSGDANELATSRIEGPAFSERTIKSIPNVEATLSPSTSIYAPHLLFSRFCKEKEELKNGILDKKQSETSGFTEKLHIIGHLMKSSGDIGSSSHGKQDVNHKLTHQDLRALAGTKSYPSHMSPNSLPSQDIYSGYYCYSGSVGYDEIPEALSCLSDLIGDFDSHLSSWHYGRWSNDSALSAGVPSVSPSLLPQSPSKMQWDMTRHLMQVKGNPFTQINSNGLLQRPPFFPIGPHILPGGSSFSLEEVQKPRGTGTYFPNLNHYRERPSPRSRNQVPVRSPRSNGRQSNPPELNPLEKSNSELSQAQTVHQGGIKLGHADHNSGSGSPGRKVHHHPNGLLQRPEQMAEHGSSSGHQQENRKQPSSVSLLSQNLSINLSLLQVQNSKPVLDVHQERVADQSYELKDDSDFPPLSI